MMTHFETSRVKISPTGISSERSLHMLWRETISSTILFRVVRFLKIISWFGWKLCTFFFLRSLMYTHVLDVFGSSETRGVHAVAFESLLHRIFLDNKSNLLCRYYGKLSFLHTRVFHWVNRAKLHPILVGLVIILQN